MTTPFGRPVGWVLIGKDNEVVRKKGEHAVLYPTLTKACDAEVDYRGRTGQRALPTPLWSRRAFSEEAE